MDFYMQNKTYMSGNEGSILVVDDNVGIRDALKQLLKHDFGVVDTISSPDQLPGIIEQGGHDVILLDMNFSAGARTGEEGLYWLRKILEADPDALVILITAYGDINLAVQAIRAGGYDFVMKPWEPQKLIHTIKTAIRYRESRQQVKRLSITQRITKLDTEREFGEILTGSESMIHVLDTIKRVAGTEANIMITGEHGTGKELAAREIHRMSGLDPFIKVDLGSIPESLFESELFGHIKGAFTDAREDRTGRFEIASGGTIFLDEIGNLPVDLQSKLLSVLQNRSIIRLGSNREIPIDVRLICATNRDLIKMIREGSFRDDLFYRINTIQLHLPPLREREKDVPLLSKHFLYIFSKKYSKRPFSLSPKAIQKLAAYGWPGNVRELSHSMEKAVIMNDPPRLDAGHFQLGPSQEQDLPLNILRLADLEKRAIRKALNIARGNLSEAARILDISRTTLYSKMEKHDL
jgi:DNA-binding NtrC family response regulator